jgi:hypothetical protein
VTVENHRYVRRAPVISGINMRAGAGLCAGLLILLVFAISIASADTVETFIKQLKDPSPEVRVKAAQEVCLS